MRLHRIVVCALASFLLLACTPKVASEDRIKQDLVGQSFVVAESFLGQQRWKIEAGEVRSFRMLRRLTNKKDGTDTVFVAVQLETKQKIVSGDLKLMYRLYDNGWHLDAVERASDFSQTDAPQPSSRSQPPATQPTNAAPPVAARIPASVPTAQPSSHSQVSISDALQPLDQTHIGGSGCDYEVRTSAGDTHTVFHWDFGDEAWINLGGPDQRLKLVSSKETGGMQVQQFTGNQLAVTVRTKTHSPSSQNRESEVSAAEGDIRVVATHRTWTTRVTGQCGS